MPMFLQLGPPVLIISVLIQVVEAPNDPLVSQEGAALSAFQYFENLRNFLVVVEEMGIPTFEVSDFEKVMEQITTYIVETYVTFMKNTIISDDLGLIDESYSPRTMVN